MKLIITAILATITALILASCEGVSAQYQGVAIDAEYSAKGGLIIYPKQLPPKVVIIEGSNK